jgi:small-conductance mechanosensitive channel
VPPDIADLVESLVRTGLIGVGFHLLLLLLATFVALRFAHVTVDAALDRLFEREVQEGTAQDVSAVELKRRRDTLEGLVDRALRVIILIVAFVMGLAILRLDVTPAIAGLGIVGLALSLGAQHLVRDYVAGAFVLIENQYSKGDFVRIAGVSGAVEDVSLRRTTLRDSDGTVHYVPHGLIQTSSNLTRTWAGIDLDVPVPYDEDLSRVVAVVDDAGHQLAEDDQWRRRILETPRVSHIDRLAEGGIVLKVRGTVAAPYRFEANGELRRRVFDAARADGLIIGWRPVPARDDGGSP